MENPSHTFDDAIAEGKAPLPSRALRKLHHITQWCRRIACTSPLHMYVKVTQPSRIRNRLKMSRSFSRCTKSALITGFFICRDSYIETESFCFEFFLSHMRTGFGLHALWSRLYMTEVSNQNSCNVAIHADEKACMKFYRPMYCYKMLPRTRIIFERYMVTMGLCDKLLLTLSWLFLCRRNLAVTEFPN